MIRKDKTLAVRCLQQKFKQFLAPTDCFESLDSFLFSLFRLPKRILATVNWALHPYLRSAKQEAQSYKNKEGEKKRITAPKLYIPGTLNTDYQL